MDSCPVKPLAFAHAIQQLHSMQQQQRTSPANWRHWTSFEGQHWATVVAFHQFVSIAWKWLVDKGEMTENLELRPPDSPGDDPQMLCTTLLRAYYWIAFESDRRGDVGAERSHTGRGQAASCHDGAGVG
jgi:hypothetical protein